MEQDLSCPDCSASLDESHRIESGEFQCPGCGELLEDPDESTGEYSDEDFTLAALGAAIGTGILGAGCWALISVFANYEHSLLALVIGGAIAMATVYFGGDGKVMGTITAIVAALSILGGKYTALEFGYLGNIGNSKYEAYLEKTELDTAALEAIGADPTDEQIAGWLIDRGYNNTTDWPVTPDAITFFRERSIPFLLDFDPEVHNYERWSQDKENEHRAWIEEQGGNLQVIYDKLDLLDLLFLFMGISTAFGLVAKQ